jgi:hypothetical protein
MQGRAVSCSFPRHGDRSALAFFRAWCPAPVRAVFGVVTFLGRWMTVSCPIPKWKPELIAPVKDHGLLAGKVLNRHKYLIAQLLSNCEGGLQQGLALRMSVRFAGICLEAYILQPGF